MFYIFFQMKTQLRQPKPRIGAVVPIVSSVASLFNVKPTLSNIREFILERNPTAVNSVTDVLVIRRHSTDTADNIPGK